jgi:excisionase family DNA binding protein
MRVMDVSLCNEGSAMLERICYSVQEICEMTDFGRVYVLEDIASGKLKARRRGRPWFVMKDDLLAYLHDHPDGGPSLPRTLPRRMANDETR